MSDVQEALALADELTDYVGMFKVGKELHRTASNQCVPIVARIYATSQDRRANIFLDLKDHDTPNTIYQTAKANSVPGVRMFNIHVAGGEKMCKKSLEGAHEGAQITGIETPKVIGVTVLTSLDDADLSEQGLGITYKDLVRKRTELAKRWGLQGVVCPANAAGYLEKEFGSDFLYVTPGVDWKGLHSEGQKQLYTPDRAVQDCTSSVLVIGTAIRKAQDRKATSYEILQVMTQHL